ncbi:MAG: trimethylamine methyltransferase family protein [Firmicutes bacterium]|nr:trimethylamine methyltransferase family protein [Bacillota bacterium]
MAGKRRIRPISPRLRIEILTKEDIMKIHEASLEVMRDVGVRFPSRKALEILGDAGAVVDPSTMVAKLPPDLVTKALASAPPSYTLAARNPEDNIILDGTSCWLSTDGCGIETYDLETGAKRLSTKKDIQDSARLADYLDDIAFYWGPMVSAQDIPAEVRPLHELQAAFLGTSKHVQPETIITEKMAEYCVELAAIIVGGKENLQSRPVFSVMQCSADPLGEDAGSIEASLVAAKYGIPTGFMPMPMSCGTAPATLAGNLVVTTVDSLAPIVLLQIAYPGCPVFFAAAPTVIDLHTGGYTGGSPEDYLLGGAFNQICDFYNIPLSMGAMATGAKLPDWQAGVDNSLSTLMPVLTCTDMLTGAGMLNGSKILSFPEIIMDCEIFSIVRKVAEGIRVDSETLAVDVIKKVGVGGNFLAEKHTRKFLREIWRPTVFDRTPYSVWEESGGKGALDKAVEMARSILAKHQPLPIDPVTMKEMDRVVRAAERELLGR